MHRFLALRWTPGEAPARQRADAAASRLERDKPGWMRLFERRGLLVVMAEDPEDLPLLRLADDAGFVIGALFFGDEPVSEIAPATLSHWLVGKGAGLSEDYWGGYVALLADRARDQAHVIRDPTGARPCYLARRDGLTIVFSDLSDCLAAVPEALEIDDIRLAGFLAHPRLTLARTGLVGVEEILPGQRVSLGRKDQTRATTWRPPLKPGADEDFAQSAHKVREAVFRCARGWSRCGRPILHRLSGGLDSAIVLGALREASARQDIVCVNEYSPAAPEGDERVRARLCAARAGVAFMEYEAASDAVRLERVSGARQSPSPTLAIMGQGDPGFVERFCDFRGALLTSGQGGDHLFHRARSALIAADAVRLAQASAQRLMEVSRLAGISLWSTALTALKHGVLGMPFAAWSRFADRGGLVAEGCLDAAVEEQIAHPWLSGWRSAPPGQVLRVLQLLETPHYFTPSALSEYFVSAPILISQPVIEACLRIPSFVMTEGGVDRALARAAFAAHIPDEVRRFTAKGETTRYFVAVLEANWSVLRETLLGGELLTRPVVKHKRLETLLGRATLADTDSASVLLRCFAAEMWLRSLRALQC